MYPDEAEISYNKDWVFLQFKYYDMNFYSMSSIVNNIQNDNHNPLPFNNVEYEDCYFKENKNSNRVKGCVMLQIKLDKSQYDALKYLCPLEEITQ